jgi:hypothetical protein
MLIEECKIVYNIMLVSSTFPVIAMLQKYSTDWCLEVFQRWHISLGK